MVRLALWRHLTTAAAATTDYRSSPLRARVAGAEATRTRATTTGVILKPRALPTEV